MSSLKSLIDCGTRLWLDSVDPDLVTSHRRLGASGATSNPIIIADLIKSGRYDEQLTQLLADSPDNDQVAWQLTDQVVAAAQETFLPDWESSQGDDGYVSFELDPLLEDPDCDLTHDARVARYIDLGQQWSNGHRNRLIKVPATTAGIDSLEALAAAGVPLNVTLIFTLRQYELARDAVWRGAQRRASLANFKSVYSIFVSRVDVYTEKHVPQLSSATQGMVGTAGAQRMWQANQQFWSKHDTPLSQEIIFASTGTKKPDDPPWRYVQALAGSDIQTNPPALNEAVEASGLTFTRTVDRLPPQEVLDEIDATVDVEDLETRLMAEGVKKFADPQKSLLALLAERRKVLA